MIGVLFELFVVCVVVFFSHSQDPRRLIFYLSRVACKDKFSYSANRLLQNFEKFYMDFGKNRILFSFSRMNVQRTTLGENYSLEPSFDQTDLRTEAARVDA